MARPLKKIKWDEFDKLCALQCTLNEIAGWFECSVDTIERAVKREKSVNFAEYFEQKAAKGKISLRRAQWQVGVEKHNVGMLIWLGKQHLGQKDDPPKEQAKDENVIYETEMGSPLPSDAEDEDVGTDDDV